MLSVNTGSEECNIREVTDVSLKSLLAGKAVTG